VASSRTNVAKPHSAEATAKRTVAMPGAREDEQTQNRSDAFEDASRTEPATFAEQTELRAVPKTRSMANTETVDVNEREIEGPTLKPSPVTPSVSTRYLPPPGDDRSPIRLPSDW